MNSETMFTIVQFFAGVVGLVLGAVTVAAWGYFRKKNPVAYESIMQNRRLISEVSAQVVAAAQQIRKDAGWEGPECKEYAMARLREFAESKGIEVTDTELDVAVEAAVLNLKFAMQRVIQSAQAEPTE